MFRAEKRISNGILIDSSPLESQATWEHGKFALLHVMTACNVHKL